MVRGSISGLGVVESPGGKGFIRVLAGLKQETFSNKLPRCSVKCMAYFWVTVSFLMTNRLIYFWHLNVKSDISINKITILSMDIRFRFRSYFPASAEFLLNQLPFSLFRNN